MSRRYCSKDCYLDDVTQREIRVDAPELRPFRAYCDREYADFPEMIVPMTKYYYQAHVEGRLPEEVAAALRLGVASHRCAVCGTGCWTADDAARCCLPGGLDQVVGLLAAAGGAEGE